MSRQILALCLLAILLGVALASGLQSETTKAGDCSTVAKKGDQVEVHYAGRLTNGKEFDNSFKRGQPIAVKLGAGQVIKGWDQGLVGMCLGEKRTLTIPPELGYGSRGAGGLIPPDSTLIFETELVSVNGKKA